VACPCKHSNEFLVLLKEGDFLTSLVAVSSSTTLLLEVS
jgi:hypothetical protein